MKNKVNKIALTSFLALIIPYTLTLTSCDDSEDQVYLRLLNSEDYIDEDLIDAFEELYPNVTIIYETFDTNETMYNQLATGKSRYDLICTSDYMIQRLASENLIQKIDGLSTYYENVSPYLVDTENYEGIIDAIEVTDLETGEDLGRLSDYAIGYFWGTLGICYNPYFDTYQDRGLEKEDIVERLNSIDGWSEFWNEDFQGTISIKDSMRDTYAVGIFEVYKDYFLSDEYTKEEKNTKFNSHDEETIELVKDALIDLKSNIFGFEVDSGKNDIVTGKIGMNLAWSGDACFSILQGQYYPGDDEEYEEEKPEDEATYLYYAIPESGANVWFDAWCMPTTTEKDSDNYYYAIKFLDFISEIENVEANMSYTGYTSFVSGPENEILDYVIDNYSNDIDEVDDYIEYDLSYFFVGAEEDAIITVDPDSFEGRTLQAMYPDIDDIDHLYIMEDFGEDNDAIVQMWEDVKVNPLPTFVIVLLVIILVGGFGYLGCYKLIKRYKVKKRKALRTSEDS